MNQEEEWVSKTQRKKEMDSLQDLGVELTKLSVDTLKKMPISEDLLDALKDQKKVTANGAKKRQLQFIGRLMREEDAEAISASLARIKGDDTAHNAAMQRMEVWRNRLMVDDNALTELLNEFPNVPASEMRTLIRNARKEKELNKPPKAFRALFQALRQYMNGESPSEQVDFEDEDDNA